MNNGRLSITDFVVFSINTWYFLYILKDVSEKRTSSMKDFLEVPLKSVSWRFNYIYVIVLFSVSSDQTPSYNSLRALAAT